MVVLRCVHEFSLREKRRKEKIYKSFTLFTSFIFRRGRHLKVFINSSKPSKIHILGYVCKFDLGGKGREKNIYGCFTLFPYFTFWKGKTFKVLTNTSKPLFYGSLKLEGFCWDLNLIYFWNIKILLLPIHSNFILALHKNYVSPLIFY